MNRAVLSLLVGACLAGTCGPASANVITFDDFSTSASYDVVPNGYGGFDWTNFYVVHKDYAPGSAYQRGAISGDYVAFDVLGFPAAMGVAAGSTFDFTGAYLTSHMEDQDVQVDGYLLGVLTYSKVVSVATAGPQWFQFDYIGIDSLALDPLGEWTFVMDNFTYNRAAVPAPVPVPGAVVLGFLGAVGVAGLKRRRCV